MRDHDAALDQTIHKVAAILGDALVRLIFASPPVGHFHGQFANPESLEQL